MIFRLFVLSLIYVVIYAIVIALLLGPLLVSNKNVFASIIFAVIIIIFIYKDNIMKYINNNIIQMQVLSGEISNVWTSFKNLIY